MQKFKSYFRALLPIFIGLTALHFVLHWSESNSFFELGIIDKVLWVVYLLLPILLYGKYKVDGQDQSPVRNSMYLFFFNGLKSAILVLLVMGMIGVYSIFSRGDSIYQAVALGVIVIWSSIFLSYFVWAIYFYNINLGLTEEEWDKIDAAKINKRNGDFYSQTDLDDEPKYNPYQDETFGLPGGTVRGMIAFTLLFGALAMLVASLGMRNELDPSSMFWDQYEFFKTAFLMMIAFYFGSRSLQYLNGSSKSKNASASQEPIPVETSPLFTKKPTVPEITTVIADQPKAAPKQAQTVSTKVFDPMA